MRTVVTLTIPNASLATPINGRPVAIPRLINAAMDDALESDNPIDLPYSGSENVRVTYPNMLKKLHSNRKENVVTTRELKIESALVGMDVIVSVSN